MGDNQSFLIGRQPFLFKIKGGPEPPDQAVTNDDLVRLAEVYTRGPDSAQEPTWRKYRHCKELSDIMDVLVPKIRLFSQPPYRMYSINGSLEHWSSLRKSANNWKKQEGPGSLTELRKAALAEEEDDGQPYVSDGSQDNMLERQDHVEDPIIIPHQSSSSGAQEHHPQARPRRRRRASRPSGHADLVTRPNNGETRFKSGKTRDKERQLMSQPKQLLSPSCGNCAKARSECYVEDARIRRLNHGTLLLRCIRCDAKQMVCGLDKESLLEELVQRLKSPEQARLDVSSSFPSVALT